MTKFPLARRLACLVCAALLAGCGAPPKASYTPESLGAWRTLDLVLEVQDPLPRRPPDGPVPVIGATSGTALGVGLLVSLALFAMDKSAADEAFAVQARMAPQLADLDLGAMLRAELLAHASPALRGRLRVADGPLPALPAGPAWDQALATMAQKTPGDALLAVRALPMFRSPYVFPAVMVQSRLLDRRGQLLQSRDFMVLAPMAPGEASEDRLKWWDQGRWRRFVRVALQSTAIGLAASLEPHPDAAAREARVVDLKARDATLEIEASRLRGSLCPLLSDDAVLVHRYERLWKELRIGSFCADEPGLRLPAGLDPLLGWTVPGTPLQPTVAAPRP